MFLGGLVEGVPRASYGSYPYAARVEIAGRTVHLNLKKPVEGKRWLGAIGTLRLKGEVLIVNAFRLFSVGEGERFLYVAGEVGKVEEVEKGDKEWWFFRLKLRGGHLFCVSKEEVKNGWLVSVSAGLKRKKSSYFFVEELYQISSVEEICIS